MGQHRCFESRLTLRFLYIFIAGLLSLSLTKAFLATQRITRLTTPLPRSSFFPAEIATTSTSSSSSRSVLSAVALTEAQLARLERERAEHVPNPKSMALIRLLIDFWHAISYPPNGSEQSEEEENVSILRLPDYSLTRNDVRGFLKHFQSCKDCGADNVFLMASQEYSKKEGDKGEKVDALRLSHVQYSLLSESEDDYDSLGDNVDDDTLAAALLSTEEMEKIKPVFPIEHDDARVLADTRVWVNKLIADFGVCPFTADADRAGIPMGGVRYTVSRATTCDQAFLSYWKEVQALLSVPERDISTVLLVFPEIDLFGNYEVFENYCDSLSDSLSSASLALEDEIQLVFFHPQYSFRDGHARAGVETGAANFARRSPWPMINLLRTPQVRAAQKGIPTGAVYKQNEERLIEVGGQALGEMLMGRCWDGLPIHTKGKMVNKATTTNTAINTNTNTLSSAIESSSLKCPIDHSSMTSVASSFAQSTLPTSSFSSSPSSSSTISFSPTTTSPPSSSSSSSSFHPSIPLTPLPLTKNPPPSTGIANKEKETKKTARNKNGKKKNNADKRQNMAGQQLKDMLNQGEMGGGTTDFSALADAVDAWMQALESE